VTVVDNLRARGRVPLTALGSFSPDALGFPHFCAKARAMGFDNNFRILRSIVPDDDDPNQEVSTDFKVLRPLNLLKPDLRAVSSCFGGF
jgi:hypothetical protein